MSRRGKVVDTWYYERDDKTRVAVPVCMTKQSRDDKWLEDNTRNKPPFETLNVGLYVDLDGETIEATDVEALRAAVWAKLDEKYGIKWERYYLVQISPERVYRGLGKGFTVSYDDVEKGTTWDGRLLMREYKHRGFHVSPWPGEFKDDRGRVQACIPATETNRKGLEEFCQQIETLQGMLRKFLEPARIEQVRANLAKFPLLPKVDRALIEDSSRSRRKKRRE